MLFCVFFFFNDTATTEIYTFSLHDALPICRQPGGAAHGPVGEGPALEGAVGPPVVEVAADHERTAGRGPADARVDHRSEEHTSELQSRQYLVCRLLLEKKNI